MCFRPSAVQAENVCQECGFNNPKEETKCQKCGVGILDIPAAGTSTPGVPAPGMPAPGTPVAPKTPGAPKA